MNKFKVGDVLVPIGLKSSIITIINVDKTYYEFIHVRDKSTGKAFISQLEANFRLASAAEITLFHSNP